MSVQQAPYRVIGSGQTPLLFAHANAYPPGVYRRLLEHLSDQYRLIVPQQRPLWDQRDPWQTFSSWQTLGDDLIDVIERTDCQSLSAAGHSLGAVSITYAAAKRPELFDKLVLIDPVFMPPAIIELAQQPQGNPGQNGMVARARRRRDHWPSRQAAFDHLRPKSVFSNFDDESLWDFVNFGLKPAQDGVTLTFPREWEARLYALIPADVWQQVQRLTQPTLAIRAANSNTLFPPAWQLWQQTQPDATFYEIADAGHLIPLEKPQRVADLVHQWLANR